MGLEDRRPKSTEQFPTLRTQRSARILRACILRPVPHFSSFFLYLIVCRAYTKQPVTTERAPPPVKGEEEFWSTTSSGQYHPPADTNTSLRHHQVLALINTRTVTLTLTLTLTGRWPHAEFVKLDIVPRAANSRPTTTRGSGGSGARSQHSIHVCSDRVAADHEAQRVPGGSTHWDLARCGASHDKRR